MAPARCARSSAWAALLLACAQSAAATTYRCEVDGRVTYGDRPCAVGTQATVTTADPVEPADRAAAAARLRQDQAAVAKAERDRERERQQDLRAATLARQRDSDIAKHSRACAKLFRRARDAHDAFDLAGPRDQPKARLKAQRADQDFAALCKR